MFILTVILMIATLMVLKHQLQLRYEAPHLIPNGEMVEIDGGKIHVYATGKKSLNNQTIVMLSGSSMPSPVYSYKKLYQKFADSHRVVVIERFGYGYSDINHSSRNVETILEQTRQALLASGHQPPYVLLPHSISGIESQLWAQRYPEEVTAIIGLDMAIPAHYERMNLGKMNLAFRMNVYQIAAELIRHLGLQRSPFLQKKLGIHDADTLPENEWYQEKLLIHKMALNPMIFQESRNILAGARQVQSGEFPKQPILCFISDGKVTKDWIKNYRDYAKTADNVTSIELSCGHMLHNYEAEKIVRIAKQFLVNL